MYYVIQVATNKEEETIKDILKSDIAILLNDIFVPKYLAPRIYKGETRYINKVCFPGYIFIDTDDINTVFKGLYFVPSFTRLLGREEGSENFLALDEYESRLIDILYKKENDHLADISTIDFDIGNKVMILDGPLFQQESIVKHIDKHKRLATVVITIAGRPCEVTLGIQFLAKKKL